jgi:hypothetical protein
MSEEKLPYRVLAKAAEMFGGSAGGILGFIANLSASS